MLISGLGLRMADPQTFLAVARITSAHGVKGEVRCEVITDFPERFKTTRQLFAGEQHAPIELERARLDKRHAILKLAGVESRDEAERLRGQTLYVDEADAVKLPSGTYFWHDIVGLTVKTSAGEALGIVSEILPTGSNDVYVVRSGRRDLLIPAIKDVVREIDLDRRIMIIDVIEGLLD
ncbi:MAG: rRNA processing protein RimM [Chloroflexota bacterium]|nr:rRNA processing protein RimM [Chloroflexota bacterium]